MKRTRADKKSRLAKRRKKIKADKKHRIKTKIQEGMVTFGLAMQKLNKEQNHERGREKDKAVMLATDQREGILAKERLDKRRLFTLADHLILTGLRDLLSIKL